MKHRAAMAVVLVGSLAAWASDAMVVSIDEPTFLEPVVGEVVVVASVEAHEPIRALELFVDGRPYPILTAPPFRWITEVGDDSSEHVFRVVATLVSGESAAAQVTTPPLAVDETVDLELQQLYVTVTRNGEPVAGLERTRFLVEDNGEPQDLVTFEGGDVPLTTVLLLDVSSSMQGADLEMALSSTRAFLDGLRPLDETMLLLFSDHVVRSTEFTRFREVLTAALSHVAATGATALNDHLYAGLKLLEPRQGRRVVLLLSDGIDSASVLEMADVQRFGKRSQALVYWLRLPAPGPRVSSAWRDAEGYNRELARLEDIVESSGGRILELAGLEEAQAAFAAVLEELRSQYVLGYYPTTRSDDGSWHKVQVKVRGSGLRVRTRRGYIDY